MIDVERFKLLHGPYRTPKYCIERRVRCAVRGEMKIKEFSDAPISWPMGRLRGGPCFLIVCGGLLKAIRRESEQAICHHWGVCRTTVWNWRKALNVPQTNEGTRRLYVDYTPERLTAEARCRAIEQGNTPEANAKKAEGARRRPPSAKVLKSLAAGRRKLNTPELRRKISEAHKRRGYASTFDAGSSTLPADVGRNGARS